MAVEVSGNVARGQQELDFYIHRWPGLLNVGNMPQSIEDDELTIAQNVYGSLIGGLYGRKGMGNRGTALPGGVSIVSNLFRFEQQTINGVSQSPSLVTTMAQSGGNLYRGLSTDTSYQQVGGSNVLGASAHKWSAVKVFDPDHTVSSPPIPVLTKVHAGSTLTAGTYTYEITTVTAAGESLPSFSASITLSAGDIAGGFREIMVDWTGVSPYPAVLPGATHYNVYGRVGGSLGLMSDGTNIVAATTTYTDTGAGTVGVAPPVTNTAGVAASDVMVIATGVGGPYIWDGYQVYTPAAYTTNCPAARWVEIVNNILFFAGPFQPNLVVGMALGHPETLATGAQNNFAMSYPVTGLGVVGAGATAGLVAGMVQGLAVVYGTGLQNFYEQDIPQQDGVVTGYAMISVDGIVYFLGRDDFYGFDGNNVIPLGTKVRPYILNDPLFTNSWDVPMAGSRQLTWLMYYNKRIYMFYDSTNVGNCNAGLVWDMNLHGWTTYTGPTLNCGALLNASSDGAPMAAIVGNALSGQIYNFDVYNGTAHNVDDAGTAINVLMQTKFFKLGQPGTQKRLLVLQPELFTETYSAAMLASPDYGAPSAAAITGGTAPGQYVWDTALWDVAYWVGGFLVFRNPRQDFDIFFEAMAVGMQSTVVQAPYWIAGFSGRISQQTRTSP